MIHRWTYALGFAFTLIGCVEDVEPRGDTPDPTQDMQAADAAVDMGDAGPPPPEAGPRDATPEISPGSACDAPIDLNTEAEPSGDLQVYRSTLAAQPGTLEGSCAGNGSEQALAFTAPRPGRWFFSTATPGTAFDTVLYVRTECTNAASELACNDDFGNANTRSAVTLDLDAGQTVFVILDSFGVGSGVPRDVEMVFGLAGVVGVDEDCDDVGRICPESTLCTPISREQQTCQEVRERAIGEPCDRRAQLGPCVAGAVCYGFGDDARCEEVRERQIGEVCDPRGELGPCAEGSICNVGQDGGTCEEVRVRQEGERCTRNGGTGPCAEGLICRQLGQGPDETFCVEVEILPEGSICAVDGSEGRCEDGTLCQAVDGGAPTCLAAVAMCPADWPVVDLNAQMIGAGQWQAAGSTADAETTLNTASCRNARLRAANVYAFEPQVDGPHVFMADATNLEDPFDTVLDVRRLCRFAVAESILACDDDGGEGYNSRATIALEAGVPVYILVHGAGPEVGEYTITVTAPESP